MRTKRRNLEKIYGHLYVPEAGASETKCTYCGWPKDDIDHCPPLIWVYNLGSDYFKSRGIRFRLIPSCTECNQALGSERLFTVVERCAYLHQRYRKKYERFRKVVIWDRREIEELEGHVRKQVENFSTVLGAIDRRLENILALRVNEEDRLAA